MKHEEIIEKLAKLDITLPEAPAPAAAYRPYIISNGVVYTAGQIAMKGSEFVHTGIVGDTVTLEQAQECARQCAINILAQLNAATEHDLGKITKVIKLNVFVAGTPEFTQQHLVANAASLLFAEVLGEAGLHARSAVGVPSLPLNSPVEIEAIVQL